MFQHGPPDWPMGMTSLYLLSATLLIVLVVSMLIVFFPRLEGVRATENLQPAVERQEAETKSEKAKDDETTSRSIDIAVRLLEPEERRVVEALIKAGGTMLQKDISRELGFSRVKTHRVLVRLIRRGVVTAEKYYNTNKIELAGWLKNER
ncbi:MAG: helix-turn-helix transcriptional regulator [Candidatus Bathyarchaeia archaeon]